MFGSPQIVGDFELRSLSAQTPIAYVERVASRVFVTIGHDIETRGRQLARKSFGQVRIQSADEYLCMPPAAVHAHDDFTSGRHRKALGMIEAMTGDVQVPVVAEGFDPFEAKEAVIRGRNQAGNLGSSLLDHAAVGRDDRDLRSRSLDVSDSEVLSMRFVPRKFCE
ncbi:MAG: hypothetical protein JWN43_1125 [Gammaproteobacteria bacterium]|nr:hypothetical protein [Gammaproteobacteria bacterium]